MKNFRDAMDTFTELGNSKDGGEGGRGGGGRVRCAKKSMFEGDFLRDDCTKKWWLRIKRGLGDARPLKFGTTLTTTKSIQPLQ
jgi:hypothetical protein